LSKLRKADLVTLISGFILAVGVYQLSSDRAAAQNYMPQQQTALPSQQSTLPQQQAPPTAPMCVYPNGASCPMTTATPLGTSCTCQQVWPGTGQVAGGPSWSPGQSGTQGASMQPQPSLLTPPPPPAGMVPVQ
jgi:hypothetical protein